MRARLSPELAERGKPKRPVTAAATGILAAISLLRRPGELLDRIIPFANGGGELLAEAFRRLPEIVAALGGGLGERRIGEMSSIPDAGAIFFELDLALEVRGHLVEFADNPFQIFDFPRLFLHLAALQAQGGFT